MIQQIIDFFYPQRCLLCEQLCKSSARSGVDLCQACEADLPLITDACFQCGIPLPDSHDQQLCGQCQQKAPEYDRVISIYHYQNPVIWLIHEMKFKARPVFIRLLGELMSRSLSNIVAIQPDAIIPVPLYYKRQQQRGFNQSEEIAKVVARKLGCHLDLKLLERHRGGPQQSGLDARQRRKNIRNAFRIKPGAGKQYRHVAVIDDVMSTGSTVNEVARMLKKHGIKQVDIWVLARAEVEP